MTQTRNQFLRDIAARHRENATNITFITPTRRAATILRDAFVETGITEGLHIRTLDEILASLAGRRKAGRVAALTVLHRCWRSVVPEGTATTLDAFMPLGEALLQDLDDAEREGIRYADLPADIDEYLATGGGGAQALRDAVAKSRVSENLRAAWALLGPLQEAFSKAMAEAGAATGGQMARLAAEKVLSMPAVARVLPTDNAVCIGLADTCTSERRVLERIAREGRLEMVADTADRGITTCCDAGAVLRANMVDGATLYTPRGGDDPAERSWDVVHAVSSTGQARVAAAAIKRLLAEGVKEDDIAVVLADASLLQPMLAAMPEGVGRVNVTMGLPVGDSTAAALMNILIRMVENMRVRDDKILLHHADVTDILSHGLVRGALGEAADAAVEEVRTAGRIRVEAQTLATKGELFATLFGEALTGDAKAYLQGVIEAIQKTAAPMDREYLAACHAVTGQMADMTGTSGLTLLHMVRTGFRSATLPLEGEPVAGLQVMGPMEMRCLDYSYVIFLGASEGTLPARGGERTTLPQGLRRLLGLPTKEDYEARGTYHFWRGVSRSSHIWLIHDCRGEGLVSGEVTRLVPQLKMLLGVTPRESNAADVPGTNEETAKSVTKTPEVLAKIREKFAGTGAMSATAINTYLNCRLRWWRECVLGIREREDIKEGFDAALFGSVVHGALEALYKPHIGQTLSAADIDGLRDAVPDAIEAAMAENGIHDAEGSTPILTSTAIRMAERVLEEDMTKAPMTVLGTETKLNRRVHLAAAGAEVRLFGITDRMDKIAEKDAVRVVDYKTGFVGSAPEFKFVDEVFDRTLGERRSGIGLQMLLYEYLTRGMHDGAEHAPTVYAIRDLFLGNEPSSRMYTAEEKARFEELLFTTLEEMFDPDVALSPREKSDSLCERCPLRTACGR